MSLILTRSCCHAALRLVERCGDECCCRCFWVFRRATWLVLATPSSAERNCRSAIWLWALTGSLINVQSAHVTSGFSFRRLSLVPTDRPSVKICRFGLETSGGSGFTDALVRRINLYWCRCDGFVACSPVRSTNGGQLKASHPRSKC